MGHQRHKWTYSVLETAPKASGIYAFWCRDNGKCIYVGKTKAIRERLKQHYQGTHNWILKAWMNEFCGQIDVCFAVVPSRLTTTVEKQLIRRLNPEANVQNKK